MIASFGEFSLDLATQQLRRDDELVSIQALPLRMLIVLVRADGELVPHARLCEMLWPDRTVDFDRSVHTAIKQARRVLGDDARRPRYLATEVGRGYRMLMPVTWMTAAPKFQPWLPARRQAAALAAGLMLVIMLSTLDHPRDPSSSARPFISLEPQRSLPALAYSEPVEPRPRPSVAVMHTSASKSVPVQTRKIIVRASQTLGDEGSDDRQQWLAERKEWAASRQRWAEERPSDRSP